MKLYWRIKDKQTNKWTWKAAKYQRVQNYLYVKEEEE